MTLCDTHRREMLWRMYPMGWYCPECKFDVITTNRTNR